MPSRTLTGALLACLMMAGCVSAPAVRPSSAPSGRADAPLPSPATAGSAAPDSPSASPGAPTHPLALVGDVVPGIDWREPTWVRPSPNSGFYSESTDPLTGIAVRAVDQSWRQLQPAPGGLVTSGTGSAQGMSFESLDAQLAEPGPFWMRIFASGVDWAPDWVASRCRVHGYAPDGDGMRHLPLWDDCVWSHLLATYRELFVTKGLRADPRLRFVYVPGAFTWAEFDFETIGEALRSGELTAAAYLRWHAHAWRDLAAIFGPYADKLVYTGEDYPFVEGLDPALPTLARQATAAGLGIRNGIPEEFDFHLSEAPSYGSHIGADGHLTVDESLPVHDGRHVVGMENECFTDCGFSAPPSLHEYAVTQTNLKALQLRANWVYVVPSDSALLTYPALWDFVRLSLGKTVTTSPDAWADLRDAEDTYWRDSDLAGPDPRWLAHGRPWVRNLERWLVQRDVPGGVVRPADVMVVRNLFVPEMGTAKEGLRTNLATGDRGIYLDVDDRFVGSTTAGSSVQVKVTFWDASGPFRVRAGATSAEVTPGGSRAWRTATVALPVAALTGSLAGHTDLAVQATGGRDVVVRFVRVVRLAPPSR